MKLNRSDIDSTNLKAAALRAWRLATEAIFPSRCVACGAGGTLLCANCIAVCRSLNTGVCGRCAGELSESGECAACAERPTKLDSLTAVFSFDGPIREAIHAFKYRDLRALKPVLGALLYEESRVQERLRACVDVVAEVPMHRRRVRERGYNQAGLLASELARRSGLRHEPDLLERVSLVHSQAASPSRLARIANVRGAFRAKSGARSRRVLLVDDVSTTGSTLNECAAALRAAGAREIHGLVIAKEV